MIKTMKDQLIEATDTPCSCCGRNHRKLYVVGPLFFGKNCKADYDLYKKNSNRESFAWRGYESKYDKIQQMLRECI